MSPKLPIVSISPLKLPKNVPPNDKDAFYESIFFFIDTIGIYEGHWLLNWNLRGLVYFYVWVPNIENF